MSGRLPDFVIIGAMKSGTTSLGAYLDSHPDAACMREELHFFDREWERGLDWYTARLAAAGDAAVVGEGSPSYVYSPEAIERMAATIPAAKLVAVLRDPVERAYSHYWHQRREGNEPLSFEDALDAEPGRLAAGSGRLRFSYVDRGRYAGQLETVCRHFPRDQVHVTLFEDLRDRPADAYAEVCAFLGIGGGFVPPNLGQAFNRYTVSRSGLLFRAMLRAPLKLARLIYRVNTRPAEYPPMAPSTRARLADEFAADNAALAEWLGRDLAPWTDRTLRSAP